MARDEDFFASIPRLRAHQAVLNQEIQMAEELLKELQSLAGQEGFVADDRYRQLVNSAQKLRNFFQEVYRFMDKACDELEEASERSGENLMKAAEAPSLHLHVDFD